MMKKKAVEVVVGLIGRQDWQSGQQQYLLARRSTKQLFAGLWEFPGGKVEQGESYLNALQRELMEELGINIDTQSCQKVMFVPWRYDGDLAIDLHIYRVEHYALSPYSAEGQVIEWWHGKDIRASMLPPANRGLIEAIHLPPYYTISGQFVSTEAFIGGIEKSCQQGCELLQIRVSADQWVGLQQNDYFLDNMNTFVQQYGCRFLLNSQCVKEDDWCFSGALESLITGWHIRSSDLSKPSVQRAIKAYPNYLWGASIHHENELLLSEKLGVDFMCISPVLPTVSDHRKKPIGLKAASQLTELSTVPVYYLGGMSEQHLLISQQHGAQGVAGISSFWNS